MKNKIKTNYIKIIMLLSIAFFVLLFGIFTTSISNNQLVKVVYASNVITDETDFWSTFYSSGSNISGNYSLQNDITINYNNLSNPEYLKKSFTSGTFDGNGKKITITGSKTLNYTNNLGLDVAENIDVGLLFGNLSNYHVKNLKVLFDANIIVTYTNPSAGTPSGRIDDTKVSCIYVGILAGKSSGASISEVEIETTASSRLLVEGIDDKSYFSFREKEGWGGSRVDWYTPQDRAVSVTAALILGRSSNFTTNQAYIKHNGLVMSQSHCKIAGQTYVYQSSGGLKKQHTHSSDYGSQAALFVGMADANSTTNLNYISVEGSGAVVTLLKAHLSGSSGTSYINNDCAGVISGKNLSGITAFNVKGLLYKYNGRVVAATGTNNTNRKSRLIIGGGVDAKTSVKYLFRDQTVNEGKVASYNSINVSPPANASAVTSSHELSSKNQAISYAGTNNLGFSGSIAATTTNVESKLPVHAGNNKNDALISNAIVEYRGFEKVTDTEYKIKIFVDLQVSNRYLSALEYKASANDTQYVSVYASKVVSYEFTLNLNYAQLERVYSYMEQVYTSSIDFKIGTTSYVGSHSFEYNGQTSNFSAALKISGIVFGSNLKWNMVHTPCDGYNAEPSSSNQASLILSVPKTAGTYSFSLQKDVNGVLQNLVNGDVIAGNSDTHPSQVYTYSSVHVSDFEFTLTITPINVTLSSGSGTLSKPYDGTTALGAELVRGLHYNVTGIISGDESELEIEYTSASFADSSIGTNKTITILGITFNLPNYTTLTTEMTFNSGQITRKKIDFEYTYDPNAQIGIDGAYRYGYIGTAIIPGVVPLGIVGEEDVSFISRIYLSNNPSDTTVVDAIDVGTYYFRLSLTGANKDNYEIRDLDATLTGKPFYITAKQIDIVWEVNGVDINDPGYIPLVYNGSDQSASITTSSAGIYERDSSAGREIVWTYVFKSAVTNEEVNFIESGTYKIDADLTVKEGTKYIENYTIKSSTSSVQIVIEKFAFSLQYQYNETLFSKLTYNAKDLKLPIKAIQPSEEEPRLPRVELAKVVLNYYLIQSDETLKKIDSELKNVGNYIIKPTYSNVNSNFIINLSESEFSFTVEPKVAKINIPQRNFVYRATNIKSAISYETQDIEVPDRQSVFITIEIPDHTEITNVGTYEGTVKISGQVGQNYTPEVWEDGHSTGSDKVTIGVTPYDLSINYPPADLMPTIEVSNIPQHEFTGEEITPNVFIQLKKGSDLVSTLEKDVDYYLTYSNHINVGQATVRINGKGNYMNTKNVNFDITKIKLRFTYIGSSQYTYDSTDLQHNITFTLEKSLSTAPATVLLTYYYKGEGQYGYIETDSVINSGSYYVRNRLDPDDPNNGNYDLTSSDFVFTVNEKDVSVTFSNYTNLVFDGTPKTINCNFVDDSQLGENDKNDESKVKITLSYTKLTKQGEPVLAENLINASLYYAKANLEGTMSHNYRLVNETIYQDFSIAKLIVHPNFGVIDGTVEETPSGSFVYYTEPYDTLDKQGQIEIDNLSDPIPGSDAEQISSWYIKHFRREISPDVYSEVLANVSDAGTYRLEVSLPKSSSHRASNYVVAPSNKFFYFSIPKAKITAVFTKDSENIVGNGPHSWIYDAKTLNIGAKFDLSADCPAGFGEKEAMRDELADDDNQISPNFYIVIGEEQTLIPGKPINAGEYVAKLNNIEGTLNNYILDEDTSTEITFEILQITIANIAWGQGVIPGTYNGVARNITPSSNDVEVSDGNIFKVICYKIISHSTMQEIEMSDIKNSGQYRVELEIDSTITTNYKFDQDADIVKTFAISKKNITFQPPTKEIIQEFGLNDIPYSYSHRVDLGENVFENITISLTRMPGTDVRDNNRIYPYQGASSTNNNYSITLSTDDSYGVRIVKYKCTVIPSSSSTETKPFSKTFDGSSDPPENLVQDITINLENPIIGTVNFSLKYEVPLGATDAGFYNFVNFDWEKVSGVDHPHKKNIEVIIDPINMENKYQILAKKISLNTPDDGRIEFTYGTEVYKSELYNDIAITDPTEVGDADANTKKGQYFDIDFDIDSNDFVNMNDLEGGFINVNDDGYLLKITMKSTNYESDYSPVRIYISKRSISEPYEVNLSLNKVYDGTDGVVVSDNMWKNPELIDSVAMSRGLSVRARFLDKNVGNNKKIYVEYFVDDRYANNFDLLGEYELEEEGEISAREIDIAFNVSERKIIYGDDFNLNIQEINLVGDETLETQHITINLYANIAGQQVALENIKDVGTYHINVEVDNPDINYTFANVDTTAKLIIQQRDIGIQANAEYVKYEDGTVTVDISTGNYYKFTNVLEEDQNKLFIDGYSAELISASHQYLPNYVQVRNIQLASSEEGLTNNYALGIAGVLNIPATVLPIFNNLILSPRETSYDNSPKTVECSVSLVDGAEIHLRYAGEESAPINAGTYIVTSFVKRGNYEVEGPETTLIINKATPNIEFFGAFRQTYGDFTPIQAKATSPYGLEVAATITYSFDSQNFNYEPAGENHTVYAIFEENTNYNAVTKQRKLVIKPKEVTINFSNYDNIVYNGQDQKESVVVTVNGAMEEDLFKPHKVFSSVVVKDAGEYSVSVSSKNPNYVISGVSSLNFRVKKANLTVKVVIDDTVISKKPTYKIIYEGFKEGDEIKDLEKEPIVIISQSKMGENTAIPQGGLDTNYNFVFENEEASYNVVGDAPRNAKTAYLPYLIIGGIFGLTVIILIFAFISRKKILRKALIRKKRTK